MSVHKNNQGYVLLMSVLVLAAVGTAMVLSMFAIATSATKTGTIVEKRTITTSAADACAEEALQTIRLNNAFTGTQILNIAGTPCSFTVVNTGGSTRAIYTAATTTQAIERLSITISTVDPITLTSWESVQEF